MKRRLLLATVSFLLTSFPAVAAIPVQGKVTAGGKPVAGARVVLEPEADDHARGRLLLAAARPEPADESASDAGGLFTLSAPEIGLFKVRIEKPGFAPLEVVLRPLVDGLELPDAELVPARIFEVSVVGLDGEALPARVRTGREVPEAGSDPFRQMRSRAASRRSGAWYTASSVGTSAPGQPLSLALPEGRTPGGRTPEGRTPEGEEVWVVEAHADGWPPVRQTLEPSEKGGEVRLEVKPGVERRIEVVDARGRPLADVLVSIDEGRLPLVATDTRGRTALAVAKGPVDLRLSGPGGRSAAHTLPPLDADPAERADTIVLDDPRTLSGRVIDQSSRAPIAGALVWLGSATTVRTDGGGGYSITGPMEQTRTVYAAAAGYATGIGRLERGTPGIAADRGPTLTLLPAATVSGVVVDGDGRPLASVDVGVTPRFERRRGLNFLSFGATGPKTARTSGEGRFQIHGLPLPSGYRLRFTKDGLAPAELEIENLETFENRRGLRVVMTPGRRGVGRVVDESDAPVAGAEVRLEKAATGSRIRRRFFMPADPNDEPGVLTDADGRFTVPNLAPGRYDLEAEAFGFADAKVPGLEVPDGAGEVDLGTLVLSPGATIEGRVLDAAGLPIAGAEVRVSEQSRLPAAFLRRRMAGRPPAATSGADGTFVVRDQRPGVRVDLGVEKEGFVTGEVAGVEPPTAAPLQIVLEPTSRVLGRILDDEGRPLAEAAVQVRPERQGGTGRGAVFTAWRAGTSGADGSFEILDVEPGRVTVSADAPGFRRRELSGLEVPASEPLRDVEIRLVPGAEVRGTVTEADGTPVVGAMVSVTEPESRGMSADGTAVTDGDGHYRIAGAGLGPRTLTAMDRNGRRVARSLDVAEGSQVVHLVFETGVEVSGHVLDSLGAPVEGAAVRLEGGGPGARGPSVRMLGAGRLEAVSLADGSFVVANVEPGTYRVSASREGFADATLDDPIEIAESPLPGVVVRLDRGATLTGRILGLEYDDLVRVLVRAGAASAEPDFEGRYEIPNLPAGEHSVRAEIPGTGRQVRDTVTVPEGAAEAVLDLEFGTGYTLTGVVVHGERPVAGALVYLSGLNVSHAGNATVDQDGGFRLEGLPEGRYRLYVSSFDTGLQHSEEIELGSDDDVRVEILTARVAGLVRDAFDLEPVEGAELTAEPIATDAPSAVSFSNRTGRSDARGYFSLGEVSEGSWKVTATKTGYAPAEQVVDVRAGRPIDDLELSLSATDGLYFEVRMASGRASRTVMVALLDGAGGRVAGGTFQTTDGGKVRITTAPAGSWEMLLAAEDGAMLTLPVTAPGKLGALVVPQGGGLRITVPELREGAVTARAKLTGPDGRPYRGLTWGATVVTELTLRGGVAQAANLAAGTWTVTVVAEDGRTWSGSAAVSPGQTADAVLP